MTVYITRKNDNIIIFNDVERYYINDNGTVYLYTTNHLHIIKKDTYLDITVKE